MLHRHKNIPILGDSFVMKNFVILKFQLSHNISLGINKKIVILEFN